MCKINYFQQYSTLTDLVQSVEGLSRADQERFKYLSFCELVELSHINTCTSQFVTVMSFQEIPFLNAGIEPRTSSLVLASFQYLVRKMLNTFMYTLYGHLSSHMKPIFLCTRIS